MQLTSYDKKALTVGLPIIALVIALIVGGTAAALLLSPHEEAAPRLSVYSAGAYERVSPEYWCSVRLTECHPFDPKDPSVLDDEDNLPISSVSFPVAIGNELALSVPSEIADSVWGVMALYETAEEGVVAENLLFTDRNTRYVTFESTEDRILLIVEVTVISTARDDDTGDYLARGVYSLETMPEELAEQL